MESNPAKWRIRPIFFKEISLFDFLEESTCVNPVKPLRFGKEKPGTAFFLPKAGLILHFAGFPGE